MAVGPAHIRRKSALLDQSQEMNERPGELIYNVFLVGLTSICVWCLCAFVRAIIGLNEHFFLHGFETPRQYLPYLKGFSHTFVQGVLPYVPGLALLVLLLGGAFIRAWLIQLPSWKGEEGDGAAESLQYFHDSYRQEQEGINPTVCRYARPTFLGALKRLLMTALTLGTGGSGGLEGPAIPIGEAIGAAWAKFFRIEIGNNLRLLQIAGIASAISTLLATPFGGAIFAVELVYHDRLPYRPIMYSLFAAMVAYACNHAFLDFDSFFNVPIRNNVYTFAEYFEVIVVAVFVSAPCGLGIKHLFRCLRRWFSPLPTSYRAPIGVFCAFAIALFFWHGLHIAPRHILGMGEETLTALANHIASPQLHVWWILGALVLAKALATGFTLLSGGSAGLLVPAMYLGGLSGGAFYYLLADWGVPMDPNGPTLFVVTGVATALVSVIDLPIAVIAITMEAFGTAFGPAAILSVAICHLFIRRYNLAD